MAIVGRFLIKESFTLTNVGFTVIGEVMEGKVNRGNSLTLDTGSQKIRLIIQFIDFPKYGTPMISALGLRFVAINEEITKALSGLKVKEQLVDIEE